MKWYEYDEEQRIKNVFSKHSIKNFWDWWSDGKERYMEVRIRDIKIIKDIGKRLKISNSASGVYVKNADQLKKVIAITRDKATMWFGYQPRKRNWNKWGKRMFAGKETNVDIISMLSLDIDRIKKDAPATHEELMKCDVAADRILERLGEQGWNKSYCKICSGNGVQLLIKLDHPIKLPNLEYDSKSSIFIPNNNFDRIKKIFNKGFGAEISRFINKFKDELQVEVDTSALRLASVGALPITKNYKYGGYTWRGVIDIQDGKNEGLSDYILSKEVDVKEYKKINPFKGDYELSEDKKLKEGRLKQNQLLYFMLNNDFPHGGINNTLWYELKKLLRDSDINVTSREFVELHAALKKRHGRSFSMNFPPKNDLFNENTVNNYCIRHFMKLVYEILPNKSNRKEMLLEFVRWENIAFVQKPMKLNSDTDIIKDLDVCKKLLVEKAMVNIDKVEEFMGGVIKKYGEEKAKYIYENVLKDYLSRF